MLQRRSLATACAILAGFALLGGCERPTRDPETLKAIEAEARMLMKLHPADAQLAEGAWPPAIAGTRPDFVTLDGDGAHITTKAYFDGGWGYFVPRSPGDLPEPRERFEEAGHGVYWWHPY
jgi:hypothetical protein